MSARSHKNERRGPRLSRTWHACRIDGLYLCASAFGATPRFLASTELALLISTPAAADYCFQLNGGSFSGDLGFFRFKGKRPTKKGAVVQLTGRVAGLSPVYGTATVGKDGSFAEIAATFVADGVEGQIDLQFFPPSASSGSGTGDYGTYGLETSFTVNVVDCSGEP
jgi:hypothetical protein